MAGVNRLLTAIAWVEAPGIRELLIKDRTREMALRLSKRDDDGEVPVLRLLLIEGRRGEESTEEVVGIDDSGVARLGTETLLGFMDIAGPPVEVGSVSPLICDPGDVPCPSGRLPKTPLLFVPSQAIGHKLNTNYFSSGLLSLITSYPAYMKFL